MVLKRCYGVKTLRPWPFLAEGTPEMLVPAESCPPLGVPSVLPVVSARVLAHLTRRSGEEPSSRPSHRLHRWNFALPFRAAGARPSSQGLVETFR